MELLALFQVVAEGARAVVWVVGALVALLVLCVLWIVTSDRVTRWWHDRRERGLMRRLIAEADADLIGGWGPSGLAALTPEQLDAGSGRLLAAIRTLDCGLPDDATAEDIAALFDAPAYVKGDDQ